VNEWIKTINKFVSEQSKTIMVSDLISEQFSQFGQSVRKVKKVKKGKKKKGAADRQMLKGLKQFNKGPKRQINMMATEHNY
jgi:hypothetical protein